MHSNISVFQQSAGPENYSLCQNEKPGPDGSAGRLTAAQTKDRYILLKRFCGKLKISTKTLFLCPPAIFGRMDTQELYNRLQSEINLVILVKNYMLLQVGRKALKGNCPLHNDNQSFMVMPGKNVFKCFGCGREGGPVEFYAMMNSQSKQEAIANLTERLLSTDQQSA